MYKTKEENRKNVYFGEIALSRETAHAIKEMGFEEPSPIQAQTIPVLLDGKDIIGQAQTGTGKTAAFGIPIVERISRYSRKVEAVIITPTRELAIQVAEEIGKIGKYKGIKTLPIYGGQPIERQMRSLRYGVQVVIGTPGRMIDHIKRGTLKLDWVRTLVLDEADEMLDMGFIEDIELIMSHMPENKQTLLFSATMPQEIARLAAKYMKEPMTITVSKDELTVPLTEQIFYEIREGDKMDGLCRIIDTENPDLGIVFCRTKRGVDELVAHLQVRGYLADGLHGDLTQNQRDRVMRKFREGSIDLLVATDVAARGIDVGNVTHVINFDIPQDPESYVHRIGRTGRAGKQGRAITIISPREYRQLRLIERETRTKIARLQLPTRVQTVEEQRENLKQKLANVINTNNLEELKVFVSCLAEEFDPIDIAAASLMIGMDKGNVEKIIFNDNEALDASNNFDEKVFRKEKMAKLFINIGRAQNIRPEDIVEAISGEVGIPGRAIGSIKIFDRFTFVEVPEGIVERVLDVMHRNTIKGRMVVVEQARDKRIGYVVRDEQC